MSREIKFHRCCGLCLKGNKIKLAEYATALTNKGELSNKLTLLCKNHWVVWREKMKKRDFVSYPFFCIKDGIGKFNLRIESL